MTTDERRCLEQLEDWEEQIDELLQLVQGSTRLVRQQADEARTRFTAFKGDLGAEAKRLAKRRSRGELNEIERICYDPAIQQTWAELTVKVTSVPGPQWFNKLYHAHGTISSAISDLKTIDRKQKKPPAWKRDAPQQ
jgi:hypothetical protein